MKADEFPSVYQASDKASIKAQNNYLLLIGLDLMFMILGSFLAMYNFASESTKSIIYIISGLFLLSSLILTIILKSKAYENTWYQGRALAESIKTLTWRFATCSELFEVKHTREEVNERFTRRVRELANEFKDLNKVLDAEVLTKPLISNRMEEIRAMPTVERKNIYVKERIVDQKKWYSKKARFNKRKYNFWFWIITGTQFFSIVYIVVLIKNPALNWNLVGLFTTISAAAISWLQLKQHQGLQQAYTTACQELNFIEASSRSISTDHDLSAFVLDSENAISREHTLWLAQKRN